MEVCNNDLIYVKTNQDMMSGMNKRPPKWAIAVWVLGILCAITQTMHVHNFNHNNIIGMMLGIALTVVWIIWAILVWHQEIVEFWLRIVRRIDPETNARTEVGNFERGVQVQGATMRYNRLKREVT